MGEDERRGFGRNVFDLPRAVKHQTHQNPDLKECKEQDLGKKKKKGPQVMLNGFKALHVKKGGKINFSL